MLYAEPFFPYRIIQNFLNKTFLISLYKQYTYVVS